MADIVPEVRSNLVMARKNAKTIDDVAGIPGRITTVNGKLKVFMKPEWGASSHMARLVLEVMKYNPQLRSAMNLRYHEDIIIICGKLGLKISYYDRIKEPEEHRNIEGHTISWGVKEAIENLGDIPDVIYHIGEWGKEPMIVLIGEDPVDVAKLAVCISELFYIRHQDE